MQLQRSLKPQISLDLTPLIDVVFQLVIFFMVATVFNTAPGLKLEIPQSDTVEALSVDEVRITMADADEIYLNKEQVSWKQLDEELSHVAPLLLEQGKSVVIEGDRSVPYETFIHVLDILRTHGIEGANLITNPGERP